MMYWVKTPGFIKLLFPSMVWDFKETDKVIYLTFDDGPDEDLTPQVLDLLDEFNAKATFFVVGQKVEKNHELYQLLLQKGHSIGNHSFNHLNGYNTPTQTYIENVLLAAEKIDSPLFRPPYGRLKPAQYKILKRKFKIIMWDVMPGDFDSVVSGKEVLDRILKNTKSGSIIVLHDNAKFAEKMMFALKGTLEHFSNEGFAFKAILIDKSKSSIVG